MPITNGTFDTNLTGWTTSGSGTYDVIWENTGATPGRAMLRIYKCSTAYLTQTFIIDQNYLKFDWQTYADNWYENPGWKLTVGGSTIYSSGFSVDRYTGFSGTVEVPVGAYIGQSATIEFNVIPSGYCGNIDHAYTYLWIDNVATFTATGNLSISSTPSGARIFIDGVDNGLTPKTITGLTVGNHTYKLILVGYNDSMSSFTINYNQTTTLSTIIMGLQLIDPVTIAGD